MKYWLLFSLLLAAHSVFGQTGCLNQTSQQITGTVTRQDFETYLEIPFVLPPGAKQLSVDFDYDKSNRTTIDLGLLDPTGFRGWSGGNKRAFTLSSNSATASYSTGPLVPGVWHVLLGVPNIREGQTANYEIEITFNCDTRPSAEPIAINRGPGWYVGDLHSHTGHSDGSCVNAAEETVLCPAFKTLETATNRGLDFIALTDHNSVSQNSNNEILQSFFSKTLLIPGREVTTFYGHANVFGTTEFIDFRLNRGQADKFEFLIDQADNLGALFSVNHPGSPSGEDCMGCGWVLENTDYNRVAAMEIVNAGFVDIPRGQAHVEFWHEQLNAGFKITGIGGSDSHLANRATALPSAIGNPSTWVYAQHLSVAGILDGIRAGNVFIEVKAGSGKITSFAVNGQNMGSDIEVTGELALALSWESEAELTPRWIHQGEVVSVTDNSPYASTFSGSLGSRSLQLPGWLRVDLIDSEGVTRVLGNPVYLQEPNR